MSGPPAEPVKYVEANVYLPYRYRAGDNKARFLLALKDKRILGGKCSKTGKVFGVPIGAITAETSKEFEKADGIWRRKS